MSTALASEATKPFFREYIQADESYVMSTWLKSYQESPVVNRVRAREYFRGQQAVAMRLIEKAGVMLAVSPADHNVIWGWICAEPHVVHYVYVRPQMRRPYGIGRALFRLFATEERFTFSHWPPPNMTDVPADAKAVARDHGLGPLPKAQHDWLKRFLVVEGSTAATYDPYAAVAL